MRSVWAGLLALALIACATSGGAAKTAPEVPPAAAGEAAPPVRILVDPPDVGPEVGLGAAEVNRLAVAVCGGLMGDDLNCLSPDDVAQLLSVRAARQTAGCSDCDVSPATVLEADFVVQVRVSGNAPPTLTLLLYEVDPGGAPVERGRFERRVPTGPEMEMAAGEGAAGFAGTIRAIVARWRQE